MTKPPGGALPAGLVGEEHCVQVAVPASVIVFTLLQEIGVAYDAHFINIMKNDQFGSGFVAANLNSKIPTLVD